MNVRPTSSAGVRSSSPTPSGIWRTIRENYVLVPKAASSPQADVLGSFDGPTGIPPPPSLYRGTKSSALFTGWPNDGAIREFDTGPCNGPNAAREDTGPTTSFPCLPGNVCGWAIPSPPRDPTDPVTILRNELLNHGESQATLSDKHFYCHIGPITIGGGNIGESYTIVNTPSTGDNYENRIGQGIRNLRLHLRGTLRFNQLTTPAGPQAPSVYPPMLRMFVYRDKVPATPGTATLLIEQGTNPPGMISDAAYSNLGVALTERGLLQHVVPNPVGQNQREFYRDCIWPRMETDFQGSIDGVYSATIPAQIISGATYRFHEDIDLGGCTTSFLATGGANYPLTNAIIVQFHADSLATYHDIKYQFTTDLVFKDIPDG